MNRGLTALATGLATTAITLGFSTVGAGASTVPSPHVRSGTAAQAYMTHAQDCQQNLNTYQSEYAPNFYNDLTYLDQQYRAFGSYTQPDSVLYQNVYLALIVCTESTFNLGASNGQYIGWYQLNAPDISAANETTSMYMYGGYAYDGVYYSNWFWQDWAGETYINSRYGTPQAAWNHELNYGWY